MFHFIDIVIFQTPSKTRVQVNCMDSSIFILKNGRVPGKTSEEEEEDRECHLRGAEVSQYFFKFF